MKLDARNRLTIHATGDEFAALAARLDDGSEIGRIMSEAEPATAPEVDLLYEYRDPTEAEAEMLGSSDQIREQTGSIVYEYAITVPPVDVDRVRVALEAEGHGDAADQLGA